MTNSRERTPGPWRHGLREIYRATDNGRQSIATAFDQKDARFIVTACNAHDDLVAALTRAHAALAMLIEPDAIKRTTSPQAWAQCVEAEAATRALLNRAKEG